MHVKRKQRDVGLTASLIAACVIGIFVTSGCAMTGVITDTSCLSFKPINASTEDTSLTKRQVIMHNAAYDSICGPMPLK